MKALCPNNRRHRVFITTAHITQDWLVDAEGHFLDAIPGDEQVTHGPDPDNTWVCRDCHATAVVTR